MVILLSFYLANTFSDDTKIIDLGNDFRLEADKVFKGKTFVYGLPELQIEAISRLQNILQILVVLQQLFN